MYEKLIRQYIGNLTMDDIVRFAQSNNIALTQEEAQILYAYTKNSWETFYLGDPTKEMAELKQKLRPTTYQALESLYYYYKDKIQ